MKQIALTLPVLAVLAAGCYTTVPFEGGTPIAIQGEAPAKKVIKKAPAALKAVLTDKKIEINEMVQFDLNSPTIKPESFQLLDDIAKIMKDHPEVKKVAIEGHASADGDDNQNLVLSDARAKSVMAYLVGKGGVDAKRLTAEGFGEKKPIADNNTEEGRIKNRRVEFNVVERDNSAAKK
jgi:OOP family OmpA-OmpF porin